MVDDEKTDNRKPKRFSAVTLIMMAVGLVVVGTYLWIARTTTTAPASSLAPPPHANSVPGGPGNPEYNHLVSRQNRKNAKQALHSGTSYVPSVVIASTGGQQINMPSATTIAPNPDADGSASAEPPVAGPAAAAPPAAVQPVPAQSIQGSGSSPVMAELKLLAVHWKAQVPVVTPLKPVKSSSASPETGRRKSAHTASHPAAIATALPRIGQILYAVMDTALNSKQPGPAMATVVSGPFKGARLLGGFTDKNDRLVIQFTTFVPTKGMPGHLAAYAVDPKTTQAAVATSVNHHYFARWGGLLAANFLAGYGQAVANSGATSVSTTAPGGGAAVTYHSTYTTEQELIQALGQTGQAVSQVLQQNFNEPATVRVAAGIPVGILIISSGD
ncbi:MAG: TrbI/VirB10 family protein [Acidiferrobacterales bacterium]